MNTDPITNVNDPLWSIFLRLAVELAVLLIIIPLIYRKFSGRKENMFSFFLMGMVIFMICVLLKNVEIHLGIALGLFAVFSIIRFRTVNYSGKDMSYLFAIMGLSAINAMFDFPHPIRGTILFNTILILTIFMLEVTMKDKEADGGNDTLKKKKNKDKKKVKKEKDPNCVRLIYDNVILLGPGSRAELLTDISKRTGKNVYEVEIRKIDLQAGNADLKVYFSEKTIL